MSFTDRIAGYSSRFNTEFRLIRTGTCETARTSDDIVRPGVCKRFAGGEYYALATQFAGETLQLTEGSPESANNTWGGDTSLTPIENNAFSMVDWTFRMSTLMSEPAGLSLDIMNKYVVFNNVPVDTVEREYSSEYHDCGVPTNTGTYNNKMMCVCECTLPTQAPTTPPTVEDGTVLDCLVMPATGKYSNNKTTGAIDIAVSMYDEDTKDITLQPWLNWKSDQLFHNMDKKDPDSDYGEHFIAFVDQMYRDDYGACVFETTAGDRYYPAFCNEKDAKSHSIACIADDIGCIANEMGSHTYMVDDPTWGEMYAGTYPALGYTDPVTNRTFDSPTCDCPLLESADRSLPRVSGWLDILPQKTYPYSDEDGRPTNPACRFDLESGSTPNGQFDIRTLSGDDCFNMTDTDVANPDGTTRPATEYTFYMALTLCYTNAEYEQCIDPNYGDVLNKGTWQTNAYVYPDGFHVSKKIPVTMADGTTIDLGQCRRTWQLVKLDVNLGGFLDIVPTVTFATQLAVEQDDASIVVPIQDNEWQIYRDDNDGFDLTESHFVITKYGPADKSDDEFPPLTITNGDGSDLFVFGSYYNITFDIEKVTQIAGYDIPHWIKQQYNDLLVTYQWQRLDEAGGVWRDLTDRYSIESTEVTTHADAASGNVQYRNTNAEIEVGLSRVDDDVSGRADVFNERFDIVTKFSKRSQLFVEDAIRLLVQLEWGGASMDGYEALDMYDHDYDDEPDDEESCEDYSVVIDGVNKPCTSTISETECRAYADSIFVNYLVIDVDDGGYGPDSVPGSQCAYRQTSFVPLSNEAADLDWTVVYFRNAYGPCTSDIYNCVCECPTVEDEGIAYITYDGEDGATCEASGYHTIETEALCAGYAAMDTDNRNYEGDKDDHLNRPPGCWLGSTTGNVFWNDPLDPDAGSEDTMACGEGTNPRLCICTTAPPTAPPPPPPSGGLRRLLDIAIPMGETSNSARSRQLTEHTEAPTSHSHTHDEFATFSTTLGTVAVIKDILQSPTKLDVHRAAPHHNPDSSTSSAVMVVLVFVGLFALGLAFLMMSSRDGTTAVAKSNSAHEVIGFLAYSA